MDVTLAREVDRLERRLLVLATVGSSGPFIGLFGTVWGIMTSFQAIAASKNTNLSVVAPGIAEALLATALAIRNGPVLFYYLEPITYCLTPLRDQWYTEMSKKIWSICTGRVNGVDVVILRRISRRED